MATVPEYAVVTHGDARPTARPFGRQWLALGAVAGPILFTLGWFVLCFVSPGYTMTLEGIQHGVAGLTERLVVVEL